MFSLIFLLIVLKNNYVNNKIIKNKILDIKIIFKILIKNILDFQTDIFSTVIQKKFLKTVLKNYFSELF